MSFKDITEGVLSLTNAILGVSATYTPSVGSPVTISGIFDNAYVTVNDTQLLKPILRIKLSDLALAPTRSDQVTINAVVYKVTESQEDGYGGSTLILQKT